MHFNAPNQLYTDLLKTRSRICPITIKVLYLLSPITCFSCFQYKSERLLMSFNYGKGPVNALIAFIPRVLSLIIAS